MKNNTKALIQDALIRLCNAMSFEKIRISDICSEADVSRQTFYNYFKDKYDVVTAVYLDDIRDTELFTGRYPYSAMVGSLTNIWEKRAFYRNVLSGHEQNSLYEFIIHHTIRVNTERFLAQGRTLTNTEKYQIIYGTYGFIGALFEWILGNLSYSIEELAEIEYNSFPPILMEFCER